jgi:hypothetical protein
MLASTFESLFSPMASYMFHYRDALQVIISSLVLLPKESNTTNVTNVVYPVALPNLF